MTNWPGERPTLELGVACRRGASVLTRLAQSSPLRAFPLSAGPLVRVALLQGSAMLLAGDRVIVEVDVGPGSRLELLEVASTIAHPVSGGAGQGQRIEARVGEGGRLLVREQPLVVAAGCDLEREVMLDLDRGAVAVWREATVLGRDGEEPGRVRARMRVQQRGSPLLDEEIDSGRRDLLRSPVVAGRARALGSVGMFGLTDPQPPAGALALAGEGCLIRSIGDPVGVQRALDPVQERWSALALDPAMGGVDGPPEGAEGVRSYNDPRPGGLVYR